MTAGESRVPTSPHPLQYKNMNLLDLDKMTDDECLEILRKHKYHMGWMKECEGCKMPVKLHYGICMRRNKATPQELYAAWRDQNKRMIDLHIQINEKRKEEERVARENEKKQEE